MILTPCFLPICINLCISGTKPIKLVIKTQDTESRCFSKVASNKSKSMAKSLSYTSINIGSKPSLKNGATEVVQVVDGKIIFFFCSV